MNTDFSKLVTEIVAVPGWSLRRIGDQLPHPLTAAAVMAYRNGDTVPNHPNGEKIREIHRRLKRRGDIPADGKAA